ncbi:MAG: Crp/Fnr family transcriptional regulator [Leptospiraceae bacterium]|nr:Crp/Fnr family transcriptional regulator [Leptospiraceae bacterium]MCP5497898.1 Crp/Fnr family transcriptional regulator [Leptospiraceae bacterium]
METSWRTLENEYKTELQQLRMEKKFSKGEILFSMGDRYEGFYVVKTGLFKVYILDTEGREAILHIFQKDDIIAAPPVFGEESSYPGFAETISAGIVHFFPVGEFKRFLLQNAKASFIFACLAIKHVNFFRNKIFSLSFLSVKDRIILFLKEINATKSYVSLPIPKQQLALLLGTTPESVSRAFTQLLKENVIKEKHGMYRILSMPSSLAEQMTYYPDTPNS